MRVVVAEGVAAGVATETVVPVDADMLGKDEYELNATVRVLKLE